MKRVCFVVCLLAGSAIAQFTTVSGTVTDPNSLPYSNGTIVAVLSTSATPKFTATNLPYTPPAQPVGLSSAGSFVMQLADVTTLSPGGSTWSFRVCSAAGTVQPAFGLGPVCFVVTGITTSGSSQDIGATLRASAPALTANFSSSSGGQGPFLLQNCVTDQSGSTFQQTTSLTNFFYGHFEFAFNPSAGFPIWFNCTIKLPHVLPSGTAKIVVDSIASNDATAGHTMVFATCDVLVTTSVNAGALSCAPTQTFATTTTAYAPGTLVFTVQSTLSVDALLVVQIKATSETGLATNVLANNFFLEWQ